MDTYDELTTLTATWRAEAGELEAGIDNSHGYMDDLVDEAIVAQLRENAGQVNAILRRKTPPAQARPDYAAMHEALDTWAAVSDGWSADAGHEAGSDLAAHLERLLAYAGHPHQGGKSDEEGNS